MKIKISEHEMTLITQRQTAVEQSTMAARVLEQRLKDNRDVLNQVITCIAGSHGAMEGQSFEGFQATRDSTGCYLDLKEVEVPTSPEAGPGQKEEA